MPWVKAEEQGAHPWPLWVSTRENEYFKELKLQASLFTERPFKLFLKPPQRGMPLLLIAVGTKDEMESHWNVANHIVATGTAGSGAGINFNDKTLSLMEKWAFLRSKLDGLAIDQEHQLQQTKSASTAAAASPRRSSSSSPSPLSLSPANSSAGSGQTAAGITSPAPKKKLKPLPAEFGLSSEFCISEYRCSLFGNAFPRTGILYLSSNWIVFSGNPPVKFRYLDIVHLKRVNNNKGIGAQLAVTLFVRDSSSSSSTTASSTATPHKEYTFATLFKGEELYALIEHLWRATMQKVQQSTNRSNSTTPRATGAAALSAVLSVDESTRIQQDTFTSLEKLMEIQEKDWLVHSFAIPSHESILLSKPDVVFSSCRIRDGKVVQRPDNGPISGTLYLLSRMLLFIADSKPASGAAAPAPANVENATNSSLFLVVPYREIKDVKRDRNAANSEFSEFGNVGAIPNTLKIYCPQILFSFEVVSRDSVLKTIEQRRATALGEMSGELYSRNVLSPDNASLSDDGPQLRRRHRVTESMLADETNFDLDLAAAESAAAQELEAYFNTCGRGNFMIILPKLQYLLRRFPVPLSMRAFMWMRVSGASLRRLALPADFYATHVQRAKTETSNAANRDQIELDLHRSLPEHPFFQSEEGIAALRDCLLAYSVYNPTVGYCQSMNILASALLLICSPEEAFFLLTSIIDRIPEYYIGQMLGSIVDLKIFNNLVSKHLPTIFQRMAVDCGMDISLVALPWFLCFFVGYAPWQVCFRLLDVFFVEGPCILFQVGLGLLASMEPVILNCKDQLQLTEAIKTFKVSPSRLWELACSSNFYLDAEDLSQLRNYFKFQKVLQLENDSKASDVRFLIEKSGFPKVLLEGIYEDFRSILFASDSVSIGFEEFKMLFANHGPRINYSSRLSDDALLRKLFSWADHSHRGILDFRQYVLLVDVLYNGPSEARLKLCYELYSGPNGLLREEFTSCLRAALMLHLQFSEKTRRKVKKTALAQRLEEWQRKQAGLSKDDSSVDTQPPVRVDDELERDWSYVDLEEEVERLLPEGVVAVLWKDSSSNTMSLDDFKNVFSHQAGPLQQRFAEIADRKTIDDGEIL
eukprot:TRINITY_DN2438_c0_g1_i1.p1 TRINITY_DN2438_c0_g1~~TRINITY_DN2438_c0_g1_i1.p1  ORF type:complete len:1096 (-),score=150.80 TRINITY_DN2438_c0_g1_i1:2970-6257(-)